MDKKTLEFLELIRNCSSDATEEQGDGVLCINIQVTQMIDDFVQENEPDYFKNTYSPSVLKHMRDRFDLK